MARVHVVANQKGGVGKTTLTVNLAAVTGDTIGPDPADPEQSRVLVVSTDPQASSVWWANRLKNSPFDFLQADDNPRQLAKLRSLDQYQHVFVDTPGNLEDGHILRAVLESADDVIVPIVPEPLAFDPTERTVKTVILPAGVPFKIVINNWDPRDGERDLNDTQAWVDRKGYPRANVPIRHYKVHTRASAEGRVVTEYDKNRVSLEARQDFYRLGMELNYGAVA